MSHTPHHTHHTTPHTHIHTYTTRILHTYTHIHHIIHHTHPHTPHTPTALRSFILEDFKAHFDLAIAWLYAEYSIEEGYVFCAQNSHHYETCLLGLLEGAKTTLDARDRLFTKLLLEAPRLTKPALEIVRAYCLDEVGGGLGEEHSVNPRLAVQERAFLGVSTLKDLVLKRHHASDECLQVLLQITLSDLEMVCGRLHCTLMQHTCPSIRQKTSLFTWSRNCTLSDKTL